jgi:ABC-2 type transport system ATP-binding protein
MTSTIQVNDVWKRFRIYHEKHDTLKDAVIQRRRSVFEELWVLRGLSLAVPPGQTIGLIGENGSGKSTLLKMIAGILRPDKGSIDVNGKISALLELGAGFEPNLTGRENIYLNGAILQMTRKEINERFDRIVEFSELEKFIDTPVKNYSSGMHTRLGFSIAVNVDPDILLVDEVLAVGDESFRSKCDDVFFDFKQRGKTIVIVSHDLGAVKKFCDYCVWINDGQIAAEGDTKKVVDTYLAFVDDQLHGNHTTP